MSYKHKLSNLNKDLKTADCLTCGAIPVIYRKDRNIYICKAGKYGWEVTKDRRESCELCGGTTRIAYDHCHATGKFRGWLCMKCNTALGLVKDDVELLQRMIDYLSR